jgi:hypothetical protein
MSLTATEKRMWKEVSKKEVSNLVLPKNSIITALNREKLPIFANSFKQRSDYIALKPSSPRSPCWTVEQQSRLIESFIMNIPVPPIILYEYEKGYKSYELVDGQQRINAIRAFYANQLQLAGLEFMPELNGCTFDKLSWKIKNSLEHRSIFMIAILTKWADTHKNALVLKQRALERLNMGRLEPQEVRNWIYKGQFNALLIELAQQPLFVKAWNISPRQAFYKKMEDVELILRFFALRLMEHIQGGLNQFLDLYMMKSLAFSDEDLEFLKVLFLETLTTASQLYGDTLFKPFNPNAQDWKKHPNKAYYEAVMVGLSRHLPKAKVLIERKQTVIEKTKHLFEQEEIGSSQNSEASIQKRITLFDNLFSQVIEE